MSYKPKKIPIARQNNGKGISSVYRSLSILDLFDSGTKEVGITEMANSLNLHKSTLSGLVYTLQNIGYLDQNPETRKYRLGLKLIERAFVALGHLDIIGIAHPHLESLRDWRGETVNMAILDGNEVVYIERFLSSHTLGMYSKVGKRAMAHSTALGKALLSQLPDSELNARLMNVDLIKVTPNTITDVQELMRELALVRNRGYSIDMEEDEIGGICVGAPIIDHRGRAVAAISMAMPSARLSLSDIPVIGNKVLETALAISKELGYLPK